MELVGVRESALPWIGRSFDGFLTILSPSPHIRGKTFSSNFFYHSLVLSLPDETSENIFFAHNGFYKTVDEKILCNIDFGNETKQISRP